MDTQESRVELDPIISPEDMWTEAGISPATWHRNWRHKLPIIRLSARRIGCRRSKWREALEGRLNQTEA